MGENIGIRLIEMIIFREKTIKKENDPKEFLTFLDKVWKTLFDK